MKNSHSDSYKSAGVDVVAGYESVRLMKDSVERTYNKGVLGELGGFGGMYQPDLSEIKEPVFVSGTDGIGTKIKLAMLLNKHDTIGIDAVAMCANDIICSGAKPLYFLDYIACGAVNPDKIAAIVSGVAEGCVRAGCALIGGETAEHPGLMKADEYDIAGFCTGVVDKSKIIDRSKVKEDDVIIGLASSGVHSNGFSLIRKIFGIDKRKPLDEVIPGLNKTLGEELLTPTEIYVKPLLELISKVKIKGISHITGGGFFENIPRCFPAGLSAKINKSAFDMPFIFRHIQEMGNIPERDMFNTFNMGIGMVCVVSAKRADSAVKILEQAGVRAYCIGRVVEGDEGVVLI
ncbi:MAG: phosphoribosylformylglycinamidine cyclo-ligase [Oscillospiraceae bacterium]|jgi:phosphoribosylformylglycinamidine cyclo-ligase|nr:phosphoribosylformylglycinamidine cyclo-ligase [Oscillospiraceae bacterium]